MLSQILEFASMKQMSIDEARFNRENAIVFSGFALHYFSVGLALLLNYYKKNQDSKEMHRCLAMLSLFFKAWFRHLSSTILEEGSVACPEKRG